MKQKGVGVEREAARKRKQGLMISELQAVSVE
jgi:hypothetical protein